MPDGLGDIWMRLARLEQCCAVTIHSLLVTRPDGETSREWEVVIRHRNPPTEARLVQVRDLILTEAVVRALAQADARGWP